MTKPLALLIDADNIPAARYAEVLGRAEHLGDPSIRRAYLSGGCGEWMQVNGLRLVQAGAGKNSADFLLAIDAMELAQRDGIRRFVLVSSDGDFSHLALRLREYGLEVHGIGETKAPQRFRAACKDFHVLPDGKPIAKPAPAPAKAPDLDRAVSRLIADQGGMMRITQLNSEIGQRLGITISTQPEKTWRAWLKARPHLFALDPKGPEACVHLVQTPGLRPPLALV